MPNNRRKEYRATNRIRKRRAELELLCNSSRVTDQCLDNKTDKKRAKETAPDVEGGATPTTSVSSLITHISRTTETVRISEGGDNAAERARELSKELRKQRPKHIGLESKLELHKLNGKMLGEREMAAFLHRQLLGALNTPNRAGANWLRFMGGRKPLQIVMVRVNCGGLGTIQSDDNTKFIDEYFGFKWVRLHRSVHDRHRFWHTISTTTFSLRELLIHKIKEFGDPLLNMRLPQRKAQLLMSLADMTLAGYPFPTSVFDEPQKAKIRATRTTYRSVSEESPIFVIDCEMCLTTDQRLELTRISVVNEAGETLIDELVKPYNKIVDYITFKSGITEKMLSNVHTRLKDIQKRFCALLTDDAILCGHSLENDLMALQLSHPFCIDTSLLFNFSGRPFVRSGLKALADIFLDEQIQNSRLGHCSLQDARATLKLLKLKLEKGLMFGNVGLGWNFAEWAAENGFSRHGTRLDNPAKTNTVEKKEEDNGTGEEENSSLLDAEGMAEGVVQQETMEEEKQSFCEAEKEHAGKKEEGTVDGKRGGEEVNGGRREGAAGQVTVHKGGGQPAAEEDSNTTHTQNGQRSVDDKALGLFDFNEAVRIDSAMQKTSTLSDCFKSVHGVRHGKKMLVVGRQMDKFFRRNESCVLMGLSGAEKLSAQCADLANRLMEYEVAFIDLHCPAGTDKRELDDAFRHLVGGLCNNSFCMLLIVGLMGTGREEDRPLLYQRVHQRTDKKDGTADGVEPPTTMEQQQ